MECKRCGNKDPTYFYKGHKGYYCRKCVKFSRVLIQEDINASEYDIDANAGDYSFSYKLTDKQIEASRNCLKGLLDGNDILLNSICGSGKTEIVVESISHYLKQGKKVAYAISRKEVVIELALRFKKIFNNTNVISVYGGHHDVVYGDLIVCTTHQLYRYYKTFDLLILDEVDAFPLKGNETLMNIAINSCVGQVVFSTATLTKELNQVLNKRKYQTIKLFVRPSNKPLKIPTVIHQFKIICIIWMLYILRSIKGQCIIFVSSIKECIMYYKIMSLFYSCTYVYSDLKDRNKNIKEFKDKKYKFIVSTLVLERGVTISGVSIIVLNFNHMFDFANYVQMLGRVGRDVKTNDGDAFIFSNHFDKDIKNTLNYINEANSYL